jgi:hypothetical protein
MPDDAPVNSRFDCPYCDAVFARERYRDLHRGQTHYDVLSANEVAAHNAALEKEQKALRLFRLKALAGLVAIYFGFLLIYAFSL